MNKLNNRILIKGTQSSGDEADSKDKGGRRSGRGNVPGREGSGVIRVETIECYFLSGGDRESFSYTGIYQSAVGPTDPLGLVGRERGAGLVKMQTPSPAPVCTTHSVDNSQACPLPNGDRVGMRREHISQAGVHPLSP